MPNDISPPIVAPAELEIARAAAPKISAFEAGAPVSAIVPRTLGELAMVAAAIIKAGMAPDSYTVKVKDITEQMPQDEKEALAAERTKARIMIGVMKGAEVGFPPITALSTIAIINNRPCIWGDGAVALVQRQSVIERMEEFFEGAPERASGPVTDDRGDEDYSPTLRDFSEDMTAVCRIWRSGQSAPYEGRFSVRDARRARLWGNANKKPWIENPKRMLMWRARGFALRNGFADCLMGLSIREEIEDMPTAAPAQTDTSFLDDKPSLPAPTDQPLPMAPVTLAEPEPARPPRSPLWDEPNYIVEAPKVGEKIDFAKWRDNLIWLVGDADEPAELDKFEADNFTGLQQIEAAFPNFATDVREAIGERRALMEGQ